MAKRWSEKLKEKKCNEFSFFPNAYTPMEEDASLTLPEMEVDFSGDDEEKENAQDTTPNWVKNLSFTIAGVTIGGAAVYGLLGASAEQTCPLPATEVQQPAASTPAPTTPRASTVPPRSTPAATPAATTSSATNSSPSAAGTI